MPTDLDQAYVAGAQDKLGTPYILGVNDCSITSRRLSEEATGWNPGSTASDQYIRAVRGGYSGNVPRDGSGRVDSQALAGQLHRGDLLFFSNTCPYDPSRGSDVTHVMTYMGQDAKGNMIMYGAQESHGVNFYVFDPNKSVGHNGSVRGGFSAFGRPPVLGGLDGQPASTPLLNVAAIGKSQQSAALRNISPLPDLFDPSYSEDESPPLADLSAVLLLMAASASLFSGKEKLAALQPLQNASPLHGLSNPGTSQQPVLTH